jgi:hypothetical protein
MRDRLAVDDVDVPETEPDGVDRFVELKQSIEADAGARYICSHGSA